MRKGALLLVLVLSVLALALAGCGGGQKQQGEGGQPAGQQDGAQDKGAQGGDKKLYAVGAASPGGGYYVFAGALSGILNKAGIENSVQSTGGGRQNAILVDRGEVDLGLTNNIEAYDEWEKNNRKNIRSLATAFNGIHQFVVRADLPVNGLADLKNYQFGLAKKGSTHDLAGRQIFEILGVQPKDIVYASTDDMNNMVKDGLLSGYFMTSGVPIPAIADLETGTKLKVLGFTDEEYAKVKQAAPWLSEDVIKAGSYKAVTADQKSFSSWNILIANKDLPDEVVYNMLDALFKDVTAITDAYKSAEVKKELVDRMVLPLHSGAVKYYKDQGIAVPDRLIPPEFQK